MNTYELVKEIWNRNTAPKENGKVTLSSLIEARKEYSKNGFLALWHTDQEQCGMVVTKNGEEFNPCVELFKLEKDVEFE